MTFGVSSFSAYQTLRSNWHGEVQMLVQGGDLAFPPSAPICYSCVLLTRLWGASMSQVPSVPHFRGLSLGRSFGS
jgi:hypothetical protein